MYMDPAGLKANYDASPDWLKRLMIAWADGLNYYLATHPDVRPKVITRFEPWMALSFTEGSIGGDIERIDLAKLEAFYIHGEKIASSADPRDAEPGGSNGIAIAPQNTSGKRALLLINPHTSFFFRSELQMTSDEGLNAYGAATWGQFFIYQGFNDTAGWMHTTSGVDSVDEFVETIARKDGRLAYKYGAEQRPVAISTATLAYRAPDGSLKSRTFPLYRTHHGPIVREDGGKWVAFAMMHRPVEALQQSYLRTKARDYAAFAKVAELRANSSNNTIFADSKGNIAYLHPQFIPVRDNRFDYRKPVDGSDPGTDWRGLHAFAERPNLLNPPNGWIQNTNNWPWSAAGRASLKASAFPRYMDRFGENPRGLHAIALLAPKKNFTLDGLQSAAYDTRQPAFEQLIPGLVRDWDKTPASDPLKKKLEAPIATLRDWDHRWSESSVANSLANFWGDEMWTAMKNVEWQEGLWIYDQIDRAPAATKLAALDAAVTRLTRDFGKWQTPWGEINRFQRLTADIVHPFDDAAPSRPVGFSSARWGSLASFGAAPGNGSKRWYGTSGNSFVAVVEFGPKVRAHAVTAGGESGHPASPHFNDQADRYATGSLREVHFHPDEIAAHRRRTYHPGE
jgi:acyl-homoserine-lactone acylase